MRRAPLQPSIAVLAAFLCAPDAVAQDEPSFEVISVRATPGIPLGFGTAPQISGGRFSWIASAFAMVSYGYETPAWRISGLKPEMSFYTISATMDPAATKADVRAMVRTMLKQRFSLVTRSEIKEANGYNLVVDKNGPKFQAAGDEIAPMPAYFSTRPIDAFEGRSLSTAEGPGTLATTGRRVPIQKLADELSAALSTFVDDRTGLSGDYYFGFLLQQPGYIPAGTLDLSPPVFDAIRDSLGLRLDRAKRLVEFLVVDKINRLPSDN